jgi:hypothetical protein
MKPTNQAPRSAVVGVFHDRSEAEAAVDDLRQAGFRDDQIGFAVRNDSGPVQAVESPESDTPTAVGGAVTGAVAGGLIAAAAALLIFGSGLIFPHHQRRSMRL